MTENILRTHILHNNSESSAYYNYRPGITTLLSYVTGVEEDIIAKTKIHSRSLYRYIPTYQAKKGGGAITLGNRKWKSITFTENFFSDDKTLYGHAAYANRPQVWLRLSAHEVGHLHHTHRFKFFVVYLFVFLYQYMRYGHDAAPLEKEADAGPRVLAEFSAYVRRTYNLSVLNDCIIASISEEEKKALLMEWWGGFVRGSAQDSSIV